MEQRQTRLEALEHHVQTLHQETRTVARQLRWWRGLAGGLAVLALLTWVLPSGQAADAQLRMITDELAALRDLLSVIRFDTVAKELVITGANVRIVNGLGSTDCLDEQGEIPNCPNGLGNLIVGYNELRTIPEFEGPNIRTGSHNVVVGQQQNFSRFGGLVVGILNAIHGDFAVVISGALNAARGDSAVVISGRENEASGAFSVVSGGEINGAGGSFAAVRGGFDIQASGDYSTVSGGRNNDAFGEFSVVSGGQFNSTHGRASAVSGGLNRTAEGEFDWVAGPLFADE